MILNNENYISGEKIQLETDLFIVIPQFFNNNPSIKNNHPKVVDINTINSNFNNPKYIYLYSDIFNIFKEKINFFNNPFVLVSHNSDVNIVDNEICN